MSSITSVANPLRAVEAQATKTEEEAQTTKTEEAAQEALNKIEGYYRLLCANKIGKITPSIDASTLKSQLEEIKSEISRVLDLSYAVVNDKESALQDAYDILGDLKDGGIESDKDIEADYEDRTLLNDLKEWIKLHEIYVAQGHEKLQKLRDLKQYFKKIQTLDNFIDNSYIASQVSGFDSALAKLTLMADNDSEKRISELELKARSVRKCAQEDLGRNKEYLRHTLNFRSLIDNSDIPDKVNKAVQYLVKCYNKKSDDLELVDEFLEKIGRTKEDLNSLNKFCAKLYRTTTRLHLCKQEDLDTLKSELENLNKRCFNETVYKCNIIYNECTKLFKIIEENKSNYSKIVIALNNCILYGSLRVNTNNGSYNYDRSILAKAYRKAYSDAISNKGGLEGVKQ